MMHFNLNVDDDSDYDLYTWLPRILKAYITCPKQPFVGGQR